MARMPLAQALDRFTRKSLRDKWAAIKATLRNVVRADPRVRQRRRIDELLAGTHAPPKVFEAFEEIYVAYRPDSDIHFRQYPEIAQLSETWVKNNSLNNAGDLPRLFALVLNIRQILDEGIEGDMAELGVYRGNSAAVLAFYARKYSRRVWLFDTFRGFDERDIVGDERSKGIEFSETSLDYVRDVVGRTNTRFVEGRFPQSIPSDAYAERYCLVHIDCDLYEPAKAGLEFFYPRLSPGGLLILHDYANPSWTGIKRAVDEFCGSVPERPVVFGDKSGTAMIRKSATI
jgi:Macrocin-O-methyltransferase (TylF)